MKTDTKRTIEFWIQYRVIVLKMYKFEEKKVYSQVNISSKKILAPYWDLNQYCFESLGIKRESNHCTREPIWTP